MTDRTCTLIMYGIPHTRMQLIQTWPLFTLSVANTKRCWQNIMAIYFVCCKWLQSLHLQYIDNINLRISYQRTTHSIHTRALRLSWRLELDGALHAAMHRKFTNNFESRQHVIWNILHVLCSLPIRNSCFIHLGWHQGALSSILPYTFAMLYIQLYIPYTMHGSI